MFVITQGLGSPLLLSQGYGGVAIVQERGVVGLGDSLLGSVGVGLSGDAVGIGESGSMGPVLGTSQQEPTP